MSSPIKVLIEEQVRLFSGRLHPEQRRAVKAALRGLELGRGDIQPLDEDLAGYHRLRMGRYRMVFRYDQDGSARVFFMESRRLVYDLLRDNPRLLLKE